MPTTTPASVGLIGCGSISWIYLQNSKMFDAIEIVACADLIPERAALKAREYGVSRICSPEELLADPEIEIVLNLTIPEAHALIALDAVEAGKSVYNEKPLTIARADGKRLLVLANEMNVRVGGAPDTFLGAGLQTARQLLDDSAVGRPVAATAFMTCHGHESWHPDPAYYYRQGAGPLFDMGPYYLTALVSLLGPVHRVTGSTRRSFAERVITSEPKRGEMINVEVPTHVAAVLDFANGAVATMIMTFDVWHANLPFIEIYGETGSIGLPDPNMFDGPVRLRGEQDADWREAPIDRPYRENSRGLGLADMAHAMRTGRPHRASGELAYHVLDVMHAIHEASEQGRHIEIESTCTRPAPLPVTSTEGTFDL